MDLHSVAPCCCMLDAGKPREAIDMYVHTQDWEAALRVAQNNDAGAATDVFVAQVRVLPTM